ncbi:hypothetical protein [Streptomyces pristinaespiralis]|uniref:hypothetical protein n=1 Tax=Streptomyces pristinaespiralis TaxID=38300 RepID=UPI003837521E
MNPPLSKSRKVARDFRKAHGPIEGWSSEAFVVFQDLLIVAHKAGPLTRFRLRVQALLVIAYAMAVYTVDELVNAVRGSYWLWLTDHGDHVFAWFYAAEEVCRRAGDHRFVEWADGLCDRYDGAICRLSSRIVGD